MMEVVAALKDITRRQEHLIAELNDPLPCIEEMIEPDNLLCPAAVGHAQDR